MFGTKRSTLHDWQKRGTVIGPPGVNENMTFPSLSLWMVDLQDRRRSRSFPRCIHMPAVDMPRKSAIASLLAMTPPKST